MVIRIDEYQKRFCTALVYAPADFAYSTTRFVHDGAIDDPDDDPPTALRQAA